MRYFKYIICIIIIYTITTSCSILKQNNTEDTTIQTPTVVDLSDNARPEILVDTISYTFDELDELYDLSKEKEQDIDSLYALFESVPDSERPVFSPSQVEVMIHNMQGEIKLEYNNTIQKNIDRITSKFGRKYLSKVLAYSKLYFPIIEDILKEAGIPDEMKYAAVIESGLVPNIRSRVGAVGFWQFMYPTGKLSGLEINQLIDSRCEIIESTRAAAKYMNQLYELYGDWLLVLAAYNSGPGNVNKALRRNSNIHDFWKVKRSLPRETRRHIPRFIAMFYAFEYHKELMIAPQRDLIKIDGIDTVSVNKPIHIGQIASLVGMEEEELALLNRHYLKGYIPAENGKEYSVYLPNDKIERYEAIKDNVYSYKRSTYYSSTGKHIAKPQKFYPSYGIYGTGKRILYRVRRGDYLGKIARKFRVSVRSIRKWNRLHSNKIRVGQRLKIYGRGSSARSYKLSKKRKYIEYNTSGKKIYHTIRRGENIWTIARKYKGISSKQILKLNKINPRKLRVGQRIRIK